MATWPSIIALSLALNASGFSKMCRGVPNFPMSCKSPAMCISSSSQLLANDVRRNISFDVFATPYECVAVKGLFESIIFDSIRQYANSSLPYM